MNKNPSRDQPINRQDQQQKSEVSSRKNLGLARPDPAKVIGAFMRNLAKLGEGKIRSPRS